MILHTYHHYRIKSIKIKIRKILFYILSKIFLRFNNQNKLRNLNKKKMMYHKMNKEKWHFFHCKYLQVIFKNLHFCLISNQIFESSILNLSWQYIFLFLYFWKYCNWFYQNNDYHDKVSNYIMNFSLMIIWEYLIKYIQKFYDSLNIDREILLLKLNLIIIYSSFFSTFHNINLQF